MEKFLSPGARTSEFAVLIALMVGAFVLSLTNGVEDALQWAETLWKPVSVYAGARAAIKAAGRHETH